MQEQGKKGQFNFQHRFPCRPARRYNFNFYHGLDHRDPRAYAKQQLDFRPLPGLPPAGSQSQSQINASSESSRLKYTEIHSTGSKKVLEEQRFTKVKPYRQRSKQEQKELCQELFEGEWL